MPNVVTQAAPAELAAQVRVEHEAAQSAMQAAVGHAIRAGELLLEAKAQLPHGQFGAWISSACGFSDPKAAWTRHELTEPRRAPWIILPPAHQPAAVP